MLGPDGAQNTRRSDARDGIGDELSTECFFLPTSPRCLNTLQTVVFDVPFFLRLIARNDVDEYIDEILAHRQASDLLQVEPA
jgi:hypothetical protein